MGNITVVVREARCKCASIPKQGKDGDMQPQLPP